MKKYFFIVPVISMCFIVNSSFAERDFSAVEIKIVNVSKNIYMLQGSGGNVGVSVGSDGVLMIDDQFAPLSEKIRSAIKSVGGEKISFLVNTHWHGDHTGGNEQFGREATIIAHTNVRKRLSSRQEVKLFNMVSEPHPKEALPVITFDESLSVYFNGEEIKAIHFPKGHTDGDIIIFFEGSNVVHMGDHFFTGTFPFIDLNSGGDVEGYTSNVAKIITLLPDDVKIIPGHGELSDMNALKAYHAMLIGTTDFVRTAITAGKGLDEVKKEGLPEQWQSWAKGFLSEEQWIEIVYQSLLNG